MRTTPPKILAALALALLAPPVLQAQTAQAPAGALTARVIVKFKADSTLLRKQGASLDQQQADRAVALGARVGLPLQAGHGVAERAQVVFASGMNSEALAARLARESDVEYAVPDRRKRRVAVPNDPRYLSGPAVLGPASGQWYLRPPAGEVRSAINAEAAWDVSLGSSSVVVAVLDTGVRFDHADLKRVAEGGNLLDGYDLIADVPTAADGNGRDSDASDPGDYLTQADIDTGNFDPCTSADISDSSWHGTQVSGIVAALTNNAVGMASVGRSVRVLPVRVLGKCGGFDSDIIAGMRWAAGLAVTGLPTNLTPAKVLNLSLGGVGSCSQAYVDVVAQVRATGAVVVASAGNSFGLAVSEPANCAGVIGVAGLRHIGTKVGFSDLGPEISLSAPGGNCVNEGANDPCLYPILTTTNSGRTTPVLDAAGGSTYTNAFNYTVGTSFSAPLVAGAAALVMSARPAMTPDQVRTLLESTATAFPTSGAAANTPQCVAPTTTEQFECYCTTTTCGAGMLNASAAMASILSQDGIVANISQLPAEVIVGDSVTLSAAGTSLVAGSAGILSYAWTLVDGGGGVVTAFTSATDAASATLLTEKSGRFVVRVTVTDAASRQSTASATVYVRDLVVAPPPPAPTSDGGGGALGLGWLAALLLAVFALWRARPAARVG